MASEDNTTEARRAEDDLLARYVIDEDKNAPVNAGFEQERQLGTSKEDGTRVLIKRVSRQNAARAAEVRREIRLLNEIRDPGLGEMHEWLESPTSIWLVIDHFPGDSVAAHVALYGAATPDRSKQLFTQLLSAVGYLLYHRIAPLRICPETLALNPRMNALVISDLSCAFEYCREGELQVEALLEGRYGSDVYVAPEAFGKAPYNARKAVMWSCGAVLYLLINGTTSRLSNLEHPAFRQTPGSSQTHKRRFSVSSTVPGVLSYPNRLKVPEWARQVLPKMLEVEPRKRAEFIEVAARVPKDYEGKKTRPLMELAWLDYKDHVGPAGAEFEFGDAGSTFSGDTLQGKRNRYTSMAW